jgi:hypothetical protein
MWTRAWWQPVASSDDPWGDLLSSSGRQRQDTSGSGIKP